MNKQLLSSFCRVAGSRTRLVCHLTRFLPIPFVLAACAMPPEGVTPAGLVAFDEAVASIGCDLVGESDYLPVELQTGLSREQVLQTAAYRVANEEAVRLENGGVRLITGACAPQ